MQRECCLASGRRARVPRDALGMRGTARTTSRAAGPSGVLLSTTPYPLPCSATPQLAPPQERAYDARGLEAATPGERRLRGMLPNPSHACSRGAQERFLSPLPPGGARPTYGCTNEQFEASSRRRGIRHLAPDPGRLLDLVTFFLPLK